VDYRRAKPFRPAAKHVALMNRIGGAEASQGVVELVTVAGRRRHLHCLSRERPGEGADIARRELGAEREGKEWGVETQVERQG